MSEWISVKDRLPEADGRYLVVTSVCGVPFRDVANYTHKYAGFEEHLWGKAMWYDYDGEYGDFEKTGITHWMPLPEPPEEGTI